MEVNTNDKNSVKSIPHNIINNVFLLFPEINPIVSIDKRDDLKLVCKDSGGHSAFMPDSVEAKTDT